MSLVLRSDDPPPDDRIEILPANVSSARSAPLSVLRRPPRQDHEPTVFLAVQVSGTTMVAQGANQAVLRAGDMVVYDSTRPYTVLTTDRTELRCFQVPRSALALPQTSIDAVAGLRIGPDNNAIAAVVATFFDRLGSTDVLDHPDAADLVVGPSVDLLRAVITLRLADEERARVSRADALVLRVQEYVRTHLADRDLSATTIAAAHHVSVRHLYASLARAGVALQVTIRDQRLEQCRRDLRDPRCAHLTAGAIGARWGFADASHFGRVFRDAYGTTPRDWRSAG